MNRRVTIAGLVVAVLVVLTVLLSGDRSAALAQQTQPPKGQAEATTQPEPPVGDLKALARAADEWVKNNPPGKTAAAERPVPKDNKCPQIPPDQREDLGLPAPTWVAQHGKVQPAVREALEAQRKLIENKDQMIAFQFDRPVGFQGTAYVDVYLRHQAKGKPESTENQAAVKEAQDRLLRKLTAPEFSTFFVFKNTAGLVGYINEAGLAKLIGDASVIAIGLDDQPRPEYPPRAKHEAGKKRPTERSGKIETAVYKALEKSTDGYVFVNVSLNRPLDWPIPYEEKEATMKDMQDRVLSVLTAEEFKLSSREPASGFGGYVTASGLAKLDTHADVLEVFLTATFRIPDSEHWLPQKQSR